MGFLDKFLAPLIERFKTTSPKLWMAIAAVLAMLQFGLPETDGMLSLEWILEIANVTSETAEKVLSIFLFIVTLLTGSSTTKYLSPKQRAKKERKLAKAG